MALDGYLRNVKNEKLYYFPIDDDFHAAIYQNHKIWNSYIQLRRLKDYYGTAKFNEKEVKVLANDFEQYIPHINQVYHSKIIDLVKELRDVNIVNAIFVGD